MKRLSCLCVAWLALSPVFGQEPPATGHTLVIIPFENTSPTPGLEWVGDSFAEALRARLDSPLLYVASHDERVRAYDRQGIPAGIHPSRPTLYRLAEEMDVDYALLGSYRYDGANLQATAQLLDMRAQRLLPAVSEEGPIGDLGRIQTALAWDALHQIRSDGSLLKSRFVTTVPTMRLDAIENYTRGMLAPTADEKVKRFAEAARLNPAFAEAWLELGKAHLSEKAYVQATSAFESVPRDSPRAREANFYLGLSSYAQGDLAKAEAAFAFVAARLPLAEVYNNLGVVAARHDPKKAAEYFERAVRDDPRDPDYHFNLGLEYNRLGDRAKAIRELRQVLDYHPNDVEARGALDAFSPAPGGVVLSASDTKTRYERLKRNYEEDSFRQMTTQMQGWAEQQFARSDPRTHARYHLELGRELLGHGFAAEAAAEFKHAATVDPSSPASLTALAEAYDAEGDARDARAQVEASLRRRESVDAYVVLTRLDLREDRLEAARQNLDRALQMDPSNPAVQDLKRTLGARLAEKGQP